MGKMVNRYETLLTLHRMIKADPESVSVLVATRVEMELDAIESRMWGVA